MAVGPGSLVAPPAMLTPKMYHLQQPLNPPPSSPTSGKAGYDIEYWSIKTIHKTTTSHLRGQLLNLQLAILLLPRSV
uniref:Uncharacterized protein n=1 Tax=Vespula pensylvanica TaxID=30213 RepID=A0A834UA78_VESPE|nr:hypothetical protein H0235_007878 [Vespula pensylvanica]